MQKNYHPLRNIGALFGIIFFVLGLFVMYNALDRTEDDLHPLLLPAIGGGLLTSGLLIFNNISNEEIKDLLVQQNAFLREIHNQIETGNKNAIEIARRQYQAEKRQTGSLLNRERPEPPK
jgi:hypothetical protein